MPKAEEEEHIPQDSGARMDTMGGEDSYGEDDYGEKRDFGDLADDDKIDVNMDDLPDDDSFTKSQIDEVDDIIKKVMDKNLNEHQNELQGYIDRRKHQQFIIRWSQLIEDSVLDAAETFDQLRRKST